MLSKDVQEVQHYLSVRTIAQQTAISDLTQALLKKKTETPVLLMVWRCLPLERKCLWIILGFQFSLESISVGNRAESSFTKFIPY